MTSFQKVRAYLDKTIGENQIPGAVVGVTTKDETIFKQTAGYAHSVKKIKMIEETIFDLASLTKVVATLPAILQLFEQGLLDLDDPVFYFLPSFEKYHQNVTIKHLLTHTSGFQPEIKFYQKKISYEEAIDVIAKIEKKQPGEKVIYSDLNFILLGKIVETVTGLSLASYTKKWIYEPLGMKDTFFNPPEHEKHRTAATEFIESLHDYRWGEVHDENAHYFGGVSGHAGLFSTFDDLALFARMILQGGISVLSRPTIALSRKSFTEGLNLNRGLGWELYHAPSFSGQLMTDGYGHTGFTGTSLWFSKNYAVILLTNRVHFGRDKSINRMRRIIHNLIALEMDGEILWT